MAQLRLFDGRSFKGIITPELLVTVANRYPIDAPLQIASKLCALISSHCHFLRDGRDSERISYNDLQREVIAPLENQLRPYFDEGRLTQSLVDALDDISKRLTSPNVALSWQDLRQLVHEHTLPALLVPRETLTEDEVRAYIAIVAFVLQVGGTHWALLNTKHD